MDLPHTLVSRPSFESLRMTYEPFTMTYEPSTMDIRAVHDGHTSRSRWPYEPFTMAIRALQDDAVVPRCVSRESPWGSARRVEPVTVITVAVWLEA
jgi:hypothetical protein